MQGKKADTDFISLYIEKSIESNILSVIQICSQVKREIEEIDFKIQTIDDLKQKRSKLIDVIEYLEDKSVKNNNPDSLMFFKLSDVFSTFKACQAIKEGLDKVNDWDPETLKELLKFKIFIKNKKSLFPGEFYSKFIDFYNKYYKKSI